MHFQRSTFLILVAIIAALCVCPGGAFAFIWNQENDDELAERKINYDDPKIVAKLKEMKKDAQEGVRISKAKYESGVAPFETVRESLLLLARVERMAAKTPADRVEAISKVLDVAKKVESVAEARRNFNAQNSEYEIVKARLTRMELELWILEDTQLSDQPAK